ncbi:hypothetical protein JCM8097_001858 [Rhodosporidiobolus ruineniae]
MVQVHPEVLWAQRSSATDPSRNLIFLTINAPELDPSYTLTVEGTKLSFSGKTSSLSDAKQGGSAAHLDAKEYQFELELFAEAEEQKRALSGKSLKVVLQKKEAKEEYWPRLTKDKVRLNWLKTDFNLWKDEDEQDEAEDDEAADFGAGGMPPGMGGMGGGMGGMPGMGGMGGGAGGMDFASMMQGMGGMGGAGGAGGMDFEKMMEQMKASGLGGAGGFGADGPDFGAGDEGAEDSDDDDGPPPLEEA